MLYVKIKVEREMCDAGQPGNKGHCAVAYQLIASLDVSRVKVDLEKRTIAYSDRKTDTRYVYKMTEPVANFVAKFDRGERVSRMPLIPIENNLLIEARPIKHPTVKDKMKIRNTVVKPVAKPGSKNMRPLRKVSVA